MYREEPTTAPKPMSRKTVKKASETVMTVVGVAPAGSNRATALGLQRMAEAVMISELSSLEFRRGWRLNWLGAIHDMSSLELQEARWLDKTNTNPYWTYAEFMGNYFESLALSDDYEDARARRLVTQREFEAVWNFHEALLHYQPPRGDIHDLPAILADPLWHQVVAAAATARATLMTFIEDTKERAVLSSGETPVSPLH